MDKDTELEQVCRTLESQEENIGQLQQRINELQQKENNTKKNTQIGDCNCQNHVFK